jgi:hypothetical protein
LGDSPRGFRKNKKGNPMSNCKGCGVRWNYKPDLDYCVGCANGKLQIAIEALEFYGDEDNWQTWCDFGTDKNCKDELVGSEVDEKGYKRAKEALEKIKDN